MLDTGNQLNSNYSKNFLTLQLKSLVSQIPRARRDSLAQELRARAALLGCQDERALRVALRGLEEGS